MKNDAEKFISAASFSAKENKFPRGARYRPHRSCFLHNSFEKRSMARILRKAVTQIRFELIAAMILRKSAFHAVDDDFAIAFLMQQLRKACGSIAIFFFFSLSFLACSFFDCVPIFWFYSSYYFFLSLLKSSYITYIFLYHLSPAIFTSLLSSILFLLRSIFVSIPFFVDYHYVISNIRRVIGRLQLFEELRCNNRGQKKTIIERYRTTKRTVINYQEYFSKAISIKSCKFIQLVV